MNFEGLKINILMSTNNPKTSPDGKQEERGEGGDKGPTTFSDLNLPSTIHRPQFPEPVKSSFMSPVRAAFSAGRPIVPIVPSSNVVVSSSSVAVSSTPSTSINSQPVITKAAARPIGSESSPLQAVTTVVHHSLPPGGTLAVSAPMASIIRGTSHVQPAITTPSHLTHPAVQATYSSHVPRGAAAVACITALKPAVATPIPRASHIFAPSIASNTASIHSTVQKFGGAGMHFSPVLQPRITAPMSALRAAVPTIPKTVVSSLTPVSSSDVARSAPSSSLANPSSLSSTTRLLIAGPRPGDSAVRPALTHGASTLPKPHPFVQHVQQVPEKGFYKPVIPPKTVLTVQTGPALTSMAAPVASSQQPAVVSHHSPQLQSVSPSVHLVGSVASPSVPSGLVHAPPQLPKVITQAIHTVGPIQQIHLGGTVPASAVTKPAVITTTAVAVTQSVSRPIASAGNPPAAAIPVAKICPTPHAITPRPPADANQPTPEIARSAPSAALFVSSTQRSPALVTTAASTGMTLPSSIVSSTTTVTPVSTGVILTEARPERSAGPAASAPYFTTGTTYFYESLPGVSNALTMHSISGAPTSHSFTTLRAVPAHQSAGVALHAAAPRPMAANPTSVNVSPVMVTMSASRHPLVVPSPYSANVESTSLSADHAATSTTTVSFSHSGTACYMGSPVQPVTTTANPSSSPRPSILRKRTVEGVNVGVRKNLLASLPSSQPPSPRSETTNAGGTSVSTVHSSSMPPKSSNILRDAPHENGQSSESTDSSCNGIHPLNVVIKQEPLDVPYLSTSCTPTSTSAAINSQSPMRNQCVPIEASPRKKPRKQQLTGNELIETHSTEGEEDFEKESKDVIKKEIVKEALVALDEEGVRWVSTRQRPPVTMLNSYRHTWKSRHNHFLRYSDVKPRDERRPTVCELANQKSVMQKANGWKVYHICTQIDDLVDLEGAVHSRLSTLLDGMEKKTGMKEEDDVDLSRANELMRGNIQRCKLIRDQMNDARQQVLKVLDHKSRIVEIVSKYVAKQIGKKK